MNRNKKSQIKILKSNISGVKIFYELCMCTPGGFWFIILWCEPLFHLQNLPFFPSLPIFTISNQFCTLTPNFTFYVNSIGINLAYLELVNFYSFVKVHYKYKQFTFIPFNLWFYSIRKKCKIFFNFLQAGWLRLQIQYLPFHAHAIPYCITLNYLIFFIIHLIRTKIKRFL